MNRHAIIFSGHMIDEPGRQTPRFPAGKESAAVNAVRVAIEELVFQAKDASHGFAGAACGGDIIFHEICMEKEIPSTIFLALAPEEFLNKSVRFAGHGWVARFENLCSRLPVLILDYKNINSDEKDMSVWERTNEWIVKSALSFSSNPCSLIALWEGKGGDGPGGTKHMVDEIKSLQQKSIIINPLDLPSK